MTTPLWIALGVGVLIIIKLILLALHLWKKVWAQEAKNASDIEKLKAEQAENQAYIIESIQVICKTIQNEDMNLSEGAIRLKVLSDNLPFSDDERASFTAIEALYLEVSELDTHENRKNLDKKERMKQDLKRHKAEVKHQDAFLAAVENLSNAVSPTHTH